MSNEVLNTTQFVSGFQHQQWAARYPQMVSPNLALAKIDQDVRLETDAERSYHQRDPQAHQRAGSPVYEPSGNGEFAAHARAAKDLEDWANEKIAQSKAKKA